MVLLRHHCIRQKKYGLLLLLMSGQSADTSTW
jgi:hypothetical protein